MKAGRLLVFVGFVFFAALASALQDKHGNECPLYQCKANCALKKLAYEECPRCYCGEESRHLLEEECHNVHGGCEPVEKCPRGPQNSYLCGLGETCCFYE